MKKILSLIFVLFLVAGCGSNTTGQAVKDINTVKVSPSVTEKCDLDGNSLSCSSYSVSSDGKITLKLTNIRYGIVSLNKVSLLGLDSCTKKFSGEVEDGFDFKDSQEITLDCDVSDKAYIKSPIRIEYTRYEKTTSNGPQLAPYTIWDEEVNGELVSIIY